MVSKHHQPVVAGRVSTEVLIAVTLAVAAIPEEPKRTMRDITNDGDETNVGTMDFLGRKKTS